MGLRFIPVVMFTFWLITFWPMMLYTLMLISEACEAFTSMFSMSVAGLGYTRAVVTGLMASFSLMPKPSGLIKQAY